MNRQIFICYRRDDTSWVTTSIYQNLLKSFSKDQIFRDIDSVPFGVDFLELIEQEVSKCDVLIAVIGKDWLQLTDVNNTFENSTDFVRIEIATAIKHHVRVIPVVVDNARMPKPNQLPGDIKPLSRINAVPISHNHFNADVNRLIEVLQQTLDQVNLKRSQAEQEKRRAEEELQIKIKEDEIRKIKEQQQLAKIEKEKKKAGQELTITQSNEDRLESTQAKEKPSIAGLIFVVLLFSLLGGFILSAVVAGIMQGSSNEEIHLDSPLGHKLFLYCSLGSCVIVSALTIMGYKNKSKS